MEKVYFLGNAHIDPVWQWRVPEGLALVKSTFRSALDRMKEFPLYVFTSACAGYYEWILKSEPEMFEEIRQRVKEGRWCITGGMWVQPDCNIPDGEAFARHFLYSQRFFQKEFGFAPTTGYNVDSFGHNGMLPQLLQKSGLDSYIFLRPNADNEKPDFPKENLFLWQGEDGTQVLAFRILDAYCGEVDEKRLALTDAHRDQPQLFFYGVGNHGGGPTIRHLQTIEKLRAKDADSCLYSGPDAFFAAVRKNFDISTLPVVKGDLQHHASGCYAANSTIKRLNRRAENSILAAEKLDVLSTLLTGSAPQTERFADAWKRLMFNQFHDILAGCSIEPAYADAYNGMGYVQTIGMEAAAFAAERISWRVNTTKFFASRESEMRERMWVHEGEGSPMVVFNPHSFPVKSFAAFGCQWVSGVVDSEDKDVPFQLVRAPFTDGANTHQCLFTVNLPAFGYATYYIFRDEQHYMSHPLTNPFTVTPYSLENEKIKLTFDARDGYIARMEDKQTGKVYNGGAFGRCVLVDDVHTDTWAHNEFVFDQDIGAFGNAKTEILEAGPLRATLRVTTTYGDSTLTQDYSLTRDSDRVDVKAKLFFHEQFKIAKLSFPVAQDAVPVYSMPFGFITKTPNGEEEPAHAWVMAKTGETGLAVLNDSKYSFCMKNNDLRMTVARGCAYLDHFGQKRRDSQMVFQDQGEQTFLYTILPQASVLEATVAAKVLNSPVQLYNETHHTGTLPPKYTGFVCSVPNVLAEAIKCAEDGDGYILRMVECAGEKTTARVQLPALGADFTADFSGMEIKTFRMTKNGTVTEQKIIEQPIL